MRLGGVVHACRALWAVGAPFKVFYIAPSYLDAQAQEYLRAFGATEVEPIGEVVGAPAVMLIGSPTEAGPQKYEFLMKETLAARLSQDGLERLRRDADNECLVIAGEFDLDSVLASLGSSAHLRRVHVDLANVEDPGCLTHNVESIITSTSSPWFLSQYTADPARMVDAFDQKSNRLILKENRGGVRCYSSGRCVRVGAHLKPITHSIGVGDCFDAAFVTLSAAAGVERALELASVVAAEYAATTDPDDLQAAVQTVLGSVEVTLAGTVCPWEERPSYNIYVAGPDFDYLTTDDLNAVIEALKYHNFRARLPIRENGQAHSGLVPNERRRMFYKDLELLEQCHCLVAVLEPLDEGTLVECGRAAERGIPVVLYAPKRVPDNLMLIESAEVVATDLDSLISAVFVAMDRWRRERAY